MNRKYRYIDNRKGIASCLANPVWGDIFKKLSPPYNPLSKNFWTVPLRGTQLRLLFFVNGL